MNRTRFVDEFLNFSVLRLLRSGESQFDGDSDDGTDDVSTPLTYNPAFLIFVTYP